MNILKELEEKMFEDFEKTLKDIRSELSFCRQLLALSVTTFSTKKQVAKFLEVSTSTISRYIEDGRFVEEVHFFYNNNDKVEFIPEGIIKFKQELKHCKYEVKEVEKILNPIALKFLNDQKGV